FDNLIIVFVVILVDFFFFFFFQAEDGIRDGHVTGVQTCALPISWFNFPSAVNGRVPIGYPMGTLPLTALGKLNQASPFIRHGIVSSLFPFPGALPHGFTIDIMRSEERRVGKECRYWAWGHTN